MNSTKYVLILIAIKITFIIRNNKVLLPEHLLGDKYGSVLSLIMNFHMP